MRASPVPVVEEEADPIIHFKIPDKQQLIQHLKDTQKLISQINSCLPPEFNRSRKVHHPVLLDGLASIKGFTCTSFEEHNKLTRAQVIGKLNKKLEALKGRRLTYVDKLKKKGIKNRIKKKMKLEERNKKKSVMRELKRKHFTVEPISESKLQQDNGMKVGEITFNKFNFTDSENVDAVKTQAIKDPKRALKTIEEKKAKTELWTKRGLENKVDRWKVKSLWEVAIQKAEGIKIKDDVDMLKKSIKKKERGKKRSKKIWEERLHQVEVKKQEAQKKRTENIKKRKKQVQMKKLQRAVKKGHVVL